MSERTYRGTVVFDIIGTCFSLNRVVGALTRVGAPSHALALWFARSLRDGFALSHAGGYRPLKAVLEAELPRTLQQLGVTAALDQLALITASFGQLEPQPGLVELVTGLAGDNWRILALTNSSVDSTKRLLERAGIVRNFSALLSCDQIQKFKPAAHAWDIQGALRAGFRTIFISGLEGGYLDVSEVGSAIRGAAAAR